MPHEKQFDFFRITTYTPSINTLTRVTGCGEDNYPTGSTGCLNSDNRTLQTITGPFVQHNGNYIRAQIHVTAGNSGSPVIWENWDNNRFAIGIITHGGCNSSYCTATSFSNDNLSNAIQDFHGSNTIYVDQVRFYPGYEDGSIFSPYDAIPEAINASTSGDIIHITGGTYNTGELSIDKGISVFPPACGNVIINP